MHPQLARCYLKSGMLRHSLLNRRLPLQTEGKLCGVSLTRVRREVDWQKQFWPVVLPGKSYR
jgi:hypothetical protein